MKTSVSIRTPVFSEEPVAALLVTFRLVTVPLVARRHVDVGRAAKRVLESHSAIVSRRRKVLVHSLANDLGQADSAQPPHLVETPSLLLREVDLGSRGTHAVRVYSIVAVPSRAHSRSVSGAESLVDIDQLLVVAGFGIDADPGEVVGHSFTIAAARRAVLRSTSGSEGWM